MSEAQMRRISYLRSIVKDKDSEIERLRAENFSLAAWQCEFTDGKTGLVAHEHGGTYCAMAKENERLREWNAEIALNARIFAEALREIAKYEIEEGCTCNACQHSALARAALNLEKD